MEQGTEEKENVDPSKAQDTSENKSQSPVILKTEGITDDDEAFSGCEEVDSIQSECEQRLDLWSVYQRAAAEQFTTLAALYDQLDLVAAAPVQPVPLESPRDSPRAPGGRVRLAVRYTTCKQLHASSQQQSATLATHVRHQLRQLTGRLQRCRAAFVALARIVQWRTPDSAAACPEALVAAVRTALLTLSERAESLSAELAEVSGRLERCQRRLERAATDPDPERLRCEVQLEDRQRQIELLQTRADNARAQTLELQTQLDELRKSSSEALEKSGVRLEKLETELLETHTKFRDSQRELYQTRSDLSREVASVRSERDALAVQVERHQRLQAADDEHAALQKEATARALQVLTADRHRVLARLRDSESERASLLADFERAKCDWQLELKRVDRSDLVNDLRLQLEGAERRLTEMETEHRDTSAALREELALRTSQIADLTDQLLRAKRTIVEQEVQNDHLQQRLEDRGDSPPPSDASQLTTARLSTGSVSDSRLARTARSPRADDMSLEERTQLRRHISAAQERISRLTAEREEALRTTDMLRTELRVALEALQNQRRETDLRLMSSSDTRLHELAQLEQQTRDLRAHLARWQLRAEASERSCREVAETLQQERAHRMEMESSLAEASSKMREIQQQLERQDQYSTWAKLNQSLQLKQIESVMLSLLKVAPRSVGGGTNSPRDPAPPSGGGGEVAPPSGTDPASPRSILKRRQWSPPPAEGADCSAGSLTSTDAEVEVGTDASLATTEPEQRFESLSVQQCDSSAGEGESP